MHSNPALGVLLHAIGGLAAASFYIPYSRVKNWEWESYWLVGGIMSWIIAPWILALLICPNIFQIFFSVPATSLFWTYVFGVLWGIGGLTFGLSVRYLGLSLGYAIALGFCAAFGTMIPPLFQGKTANLFTTASGQVTVVGVAVCLVGIAVCGWAGIRKESELAPDEKTANIREFNFLKGLWVAVFAGIMSACMAFAFAAGKPISDAAKDGGTPEMFVNLPVLIVALFGGFTTNLIWCLYLNKKNKTFSNYTKGRGASLGANYFFAALAGLTWYLQFFFYSMGTTRMGAYDFSSWTIHMAFIIAFSNVWGLWFREWKGSSSKTIRTVGTGIAVLALSTIVVGIGNYLAKH